MTDARLAGTVREVLLTTNPATRAAGAVREVLIATPPALTAAGLVREVLLRGDVAVPGGQTAVAINTG